jgi:pimeloyl-ACP methyl ester carboxylesterase
MRAFVARTSGLDRRGGRGRRSCAASLLVGLGLTGGAVPASVLVAPSVARAQTAASCSSIDFPVSVGGEAGTIAGTLCVPPGARTVQLLLHGYTYGQYYWDFPLDPERYSYVRAANAAGFATLAIDRLGTVGSLQPLSVLVTLDNNASIAHELVGALRDGQLGAAFENVVLVGHSFGSLIAYLEAGRYGDVDALVSTGASHQVNAVNVATRVLLGSPPAVLDPKFASLLLDPGYVTTTAGRREMFYELDDADPAVIALDEELKQTGALAEAITYLPDYLFNASSAIDVPVLTVNGSEEPFFCNGLLAADCSSSAALAASERPFFGPSASVEALVVPGAGHNLSLELGASDTHAAIIEWLERIGL